MMQGVLSRGFVLLMLPLMSACVSFNEQAPPPQRYLLHPVTPTEDIPMPELPVSIVVARPQVAPGLDTERIAVVRDRRQLDYYADARWAGTLPAVLHEFFVASLENSYRLPGLGEDPVRSDARYRLDFKVRAFQAEYVDDDIEAAPMLRVTLVAAFVRRDDDRTVLRLKQSRSAQATSNSLGAVTHGIERLTQDSFVELLNAFATELEGKRER